MFYIIKFFLVTYWIVGSNNFITLFLNGSRNLKNLLIYLIAGAEYIVKDATTCRGLECIKFNDTLFETETNTLDSDPVRRAKPQNSDSLMFYLFGAFILMTLGNYVLKSIENYKISEDDDDNNDSDWKDEDTSDEEID